MENITTLSIFRFEGWKNCYWAFSQMYFAHKHLKKVKGQRFYKLMGSGRSMGFNPLPDWNSYALLQVWESEKDAMEFFEYNTLAQQYMARKKQHVTLFLRTIRTKGAWGGMKPFANISPIDMENPLRVVLTRARIKKSRMISFWKAVPESQSRLGDFPDLLYSKGVGELPFIEMATVSVWKNEEAIKSFAYKNASHKKVVMKTKRVGWYSEELFARFQPYKMFGRLLAEHAELKELLESEYA